MSGSRSAAILFLSLIIAISVSGCTDNSGSYPSSDSVLNVSSSYSSQELTQESGDTTNAADALKAGTSDGTSGDHVGKSTTETPPLNVSSTPPFVPSINESTISTPSSNESTVSPPSSNESTVSPPSTNESTVTPPSTNESTVTPPSSNESTVSPPSSNESTVTPPVSGDDILTISLHDSTGNPLSGGSVKYYSGGWHDLGTTDENGHLKKELDDGTYTFRMAYANGYYDISQNIANDLTVEFTTINTTAELRDSNGLLMDSGSVKYYSGGWYDLGTTTDGAVSKELLPGSYTFRMSYAHGYNDISQNIANDPSVEFTTVNTTVELRDSNGLLMDAGTVKYYSGGWYDLGTTVDGVVSKELFPSSYTFRMAYDHASKDLSQNIGVDPIVTFSTANVRVEFKDSNNDLMDAGTVKYYSGGWYDVGTIDNGVVFREMLPNTYKFRMTYDYASNDIISQNIGVDPVVQFSTVNATIKLTDSIGNPVDTGVVKYYSGGWHDLGSTVNGVVFRELLPNTYKFRLAYEHGSNDISQDIGIEPTVIFSTVNSKIELKDSSGVFIDDGSVKYYSGGWHDYGVISDGVTSKELLPNTYKFRMSYAYASKDISQNIGSDPTVVFSTVNTTVEFKDSTAELKDSGTVTYYSGSWREFGTISNGIVFKEMLPNTYKFRMSYDHASNDIRSQNVGLDPILRFSTINATVELRDSNGDLIDEGVIKYYSGGWHDFGTTTNGVVSRELLPNTYKFLMTYEHGSNDRFHDIGANGRMVFSTINTTVELRDSTTGLIDTGSVKYYSGGWHDIGDTVNGVVSKELLPNNYKFLMTYGHGSNDKYQNIGSDPIVVFTTVNTLVELRDSENNLMDSGSVKYYSGGWHEFGTTANGLVSRELLPNNYRFFMTTDTYASNDVPQDIGSNPAVIFSTGKVISESGNCTQYYVLGWKPFENGVELLPGSYKFTFSDGTPDAYYTVESDTTNYIH